MPAPAPEPGRIAGIFAASVTGKDGQLTEVELGPGTAMTSRAEFVRNKLPSASGGAAGHESKPAIPFLNCELTTKKMRISRDELVNLVGGDVVFVAPTNEIFTLYNVIVKEPGPQEDWTTGTTSITFEGDHAAWS